MLFDFNIEILQQLQEQNGVHASSVCDPSELWSAIEMEDGWVEFILQSFLSPQGARESNTI